MFDTLSAQERQAISYYNSKIEKGDTYDRPVWVDNFSQSIFFELAPGGEVIDVGCGIGRTIAMLPDLGITRYFGIDPAESQITYCRNTFPRLEFEVNEIRRIGDSYPNRFDGFFLLAVLLHIPRSDLDISLGSLRKAVKEGAVGFLAFPYSDGQIMEYVSSIAEIKCTLYTIAEVSESLRKNGFVIARERVDEQMFLGHLIAV